MNNDKVGKKADKNLLVFEEDHIGKEDYIRIGNFSFLDPDHSVKNFKYNYHSPENVSNCFNFLFSKMEVKLIIYLSVEDDSLLTSKKLRKTLKSLYDSLPHLNKLGITNKNILICLFFLYFSSEHSFNQVFPDLEYLSSCCTGDPNFNFSYLHSLSSSNIPINSFGFNRNNSTYVESLKCFYLNVIPDLHFGYDKNSKANVIVWENGIFPAPKTITKLMNVPDSQAMAAMPAIESKPINFIGEVQQFQLTIKQIYSLHYYDMTSSSPLDHRFYYIKIDPNIYKIIKDYFLYNINPNAAIKYHDFKFGIYLDYNNYETTFIKEIKVTYTENQITFTDLMRNYTEEQSAYFLCFFTLINNIFTQCSGNSFKLLKKFFLVFFILEILFEFLRPGFTILILFTILSETFSKEDSRITTYIIVLYAGCLILNCCFSLISSKQTTHDRTFILLAVLFSLIYLMIAFCGIIAIHFVRVNNINSSYKFNSAALIVLVSINILSYIIPIFFHIIEFKNNIFRFFKYLLVEYVSTMTVFSIHSLMNFTDQYGQRNKKGQNDEDILAILNERKKFFIFIFTMTNIFTGFFCFYLVDRNKRMNLLMGLGIVVTIFNGIKTMAIIISFVRLYSNSKSLLGKNASDNDSDNSSASRSKKNKSESNLSDSSNGGEDNVEKDNTESSNNNDNYYDEDGEYKSSNNIDEEQQEKTDSQNEQESSSNEKKKKSRKKSHKSSKKNKNNNKENDDDDVIPDTNANLDKDENHREKKKRSKSKKKL